MVEVLGFRVLWVCGLGFRVWGVWAFSEFGGVLVAKRSESGVWGIGFKATRSIVKDSRVSKTCPKKGVG